MTGSAVQYFTSLQAGHITPVVTMLSIFAGSLAAGLAGFAFSAISGAMHAVPLLLACSITTQLLSITKLWRTMRWRQCMPYLIGGFVGIPVGAKLLEDVSPHAFAAGFGGFLDCYSLYMFLRPRLAIRGGGRFAEVAGGVTGGATAFPGAVPTILCNVRACRNSSNAGSSSRSSC